MHALLFVIVLTAWSVGLTFGLTIWLQGYIGIGWQWLLFPVSFVISAIGDRWLKPAQLLADIKGGLQEAMALRRENKE